MSPRHEVYYLSEGTIFLVQDCLFKVPRYMLELHSPVFKDMFSLSSGDSLANLEGKSDANPIHLEGVTSIDFERILALYFPLKIEYGTFTAQWHEDHWTSILKLADLWLMTRARTLAIENLDRVASSIAKVILGRKFDHKMWIVDGFTALCLRAEMLTEAEASQLSLKDTLACASAREKIRAWVIARALHRNYPMAWSGNYENEDHTGYTGHSEVKQIIDQAFHFSREPGFSIAAEIY